MRIRLIGTIALLLVALGACSGASSQALASPFGTVTQRIDSTTISVEYYRPSARGRAISGSLIHWGRMWTPGANWATTLEVNHDVIIEGQPLPSGKYSMWMIPGPDAWVVTLSRAARRFHVTPPDSTDEQLRFRVAVDSGPPLEVLTFSFPEVSRDGATLRFQWGKTTIPLRIRVHPGAAATSTAHPLGGYAGVYQIRSTPSGPPRRYEITLEGDRLRVRTTADFVEDGLDTEFDLVPAGGDGFHARQYKGGVVVGTEADELLTFRLEGGRVVGFEIKGIAENKVLARATRQ